MKISICMATYNGARFIEQQLQTILEQTLQPDEVIICDDCSTDGTPDLVETFIEKHDLAKRYRLYRNKENKGYPGNFYYAMGKVTGDIVFLADQDDVWHVDKLRKMTEVMCIHEDITILSSKWGIIDANGEEVRSFLKPRVKQDGSVYRIDVQQILYKFQSNAMTMCYRNERIKPVIERIQTYKVPHDLIMAILTSEQDGFYGMNSCLQWHRRHDSNTEKQEHKVNKLLSRERKLEEISTYLQYLDRLCGMGDVWTQDTRKALEHKKVIMMARYENLYKGSTVGVLNTYRTHRKYIRISTVLCDFFINIFHLR